MKSTNNLTPQFWGKRKPLDHYFKHGWVKFAVDRKPKQLMYLINRCTISNLSDLEKGIVKDKEHLDQLLSIKSIDEIPNRGEITN